MVFKTIKKNGSKYKNKSILIIIISSFVLLWCIRDCFEIIMPIYEKIIYLGIITAFLMVALSQIINTWFNIIVSRKFVVLYDRLYGIKFINREKIADVDIVDEFSDTKKQIRFWGYKLRDASDVLISMSNGSMFVVRCQTPEKLYQILNTN